MKIGGDDFVRQMDKGTDFVQTAFQSSQGIVESKVPTLIFKGVVIDINFKTTSTYLQAAMNPPFSVYAKLIGIDDDTDAPEYQIEKTYYPPLLSMHSISIPEIGEEVLILKETPEVSAAGYYVGRVNDGTALNIRYARDYVGNQQSTANVYKYGFSFDVRKLRQAKIDKMPSSKFNNISIPMTYGDVVQQGRSKTYVRHSFNRNNKDGVLEQGILEEGQLSSNNIQQNTYASIGRGRNKEMINNGASITPNSLQNAYTGGVVGRMGNLLQSENNIPIQNYDPSIGITRTKTIHFVDSSIKRLGDYNIQSDPTKKMADSLDGEEKSMIVNMADEIYNISNKDNSGNIYRQVLGEKLITHQRQSTQLIKLMLDGLSGMADTMSVFLSAFVEHEHALPKIELNLEKTIEHRDRYVQPAVFTPQEPETIRIPARRIRMRTGTTESGRPIYGYTTVPGFTKQVERPPKMTRPPRVRSRNVSQEINFEAIIGGEEDPRFTAPIETNSGDIENPSPMGLKTQTVSESAEGLVELFSTQKELLDRLFIRANDFLSKNQYIN